MVSCLSPPAPSRPQTLFPSSKLQFLSVSPPRRSVLVLVFFFLVFGRIRVPSESLLVEGDDHLRTLHVGLLGGHQVGFVRVFPAQTEKNKKATNSDFWHGYTTHFKSLDNRGRQRLSHCSSLNSCPAVTVHTHHFMRNMSSPVESVAPIILSGSSPRAKPRSFSVWGSNNEMQLSKMFSIDTNCLQHVTANIWI